MRVFSGCTGVEIDGRAAYLARAALKLAQERAPYSAAALTNGRYEVVDVELAPGNRRRHQPPAGHPHAVLAVICRSEAQSLRMTLGIDVAELLRGEICA
jgi:hypothetical protein